MEDVYYRAVKDNFIWKKGAIVQYDEENDDYNIISDVWDVVRKNQDTQIADKRNVENNPEWWERVYAVVKDESVPVDETTPFESPAMYQTTLGSNFVPKHATITTTMYTGSSKHA